MDIDIKEDLFQAVFQQTNSALIIAEKNLIIACNPQAKKLLNIDKSEPLKELPLSLQSLVNFQNTDKNTSPVPHTVLLDNNIPVSVKVSNLELSIQTLTLIQLNTTGNVSDNFNDSEKQLSIVFNRSPVGIAINDFKTGIFIDVNPSFAKTAGRTREELIGMHYKEMTPPEHADIDAEAVTQLFMDDAFPEFEKEFIRKDGTRYKIRLNGIALTNKEGKKVVWSVVEDVTSQKQLKEKVNHFKSFVHQVEKQANIGTWEWDITNKNFVCSENIYEIYGIDRKMPEMSYEKLLKTVHPDDITSLQEIHKESLKNRDSYCHIHRLVMSDGSTKYINNTCNTTFDMRGFPLKYTGTAQDITQSHKALLLANNMAAFVRYSKNFIAFTDLEGAVNFISDAGQSIIDRDSEIPIKSITIAEFYIEDQRHILEDEVIPILLSSGRWSGELKLKQQTTNKEILTHCDAFRIDDQETGKPISLAFISNDITQQRHYETEIKQYHSHLEDEIREKSREVEIEKNDKKQTLSKIDHGFRTHLNTILHFGQQLESEFNDTASIQNENVSKIVISANQLITLLDDTLDNE